MDRNKSDGIAKRSDATLGASNYTYAEAFADTQLPSWVGAHIRAWEFFGGVAEITVPDNPKT